MGHPHYSRAPITEAIIDIRVTPRKGANASDIDKLASDLKDRFPESRPIFEGQLHVAMSPSTKPSVDAHQQHLGRQFFDQKSSRAAQLTTLGMTFSHLPPYSNWNDFKAEAEELWATYLNVMHPSDVTRMAVRYVNRLEFPAGRIEEKEYFNFYPQIPSGIEQDVIGLFMQVRMPQPDIGAIAVINQALLDSEQKDRVAMLLDIDVFKSASVTPSGTVVWEVLEGLRSRKNDIFNACLTDKAKELIK